MKQCRGLNIHSTDLKWVQTVIRTIQTPTSNGFVMCIPCSLSDGISSIRWLTFIHILMLLILLYNVLFENVIYYIIIWPVDPLICSTFSAGWPKGDDHEKRNIWTNFRQTGVTIRHHERRRIIQMLPWSEFIDSSETVQRNSITRFKTQKLCMKIVMLSVKICCFGTTSMYFYVNNKHYANFFLSDFFFVGILCLVEPLQRNICIHM